MDVDRHCDVSSSRTKRVTLRGTYFSVDEKEKKEKFHDRIYVPLFRTWIKIDHPNYIYTVVFPTKKEGKNFLQSYPISRIDFLLAHGDGAKVKICDRGGFDRRVALEPSTCSRGALRSHYLMVITGVERPIGREV